MVQEVWDRALAEINCDLVPRVSLFLPFPRKKQDPGAEEGSRVEQKEILGTDLESLCYVVF